jgi:hypothetical protein
MRNTARETVRSDAGRLSVAELEGVLDVLSAEWMDLEVLDERGFDNLADLFVVDSGTDPHGVGEVLVEPCGKSFGVLARRFRFVSHCIGR